MKLKARFALFRCTRCRKSYSNPLGHVCVSSRNTPRRTKLAVRATVTRTCPKCRKPANNPLTHVCVIRSDFKRRKAAHEKAQASARRKAAAAARPKHLYQACADTDCKRLPCVAWKEGRAEGYKEGEAAGYAAGMAAGVASC